MAQFTQITERSVLIEDDLLATLYQLVDQVERFPPDYFVEWVMGHSSLLLVFSKNVAADQVECGLQTRTGKPVVANPGDAERVAGSGMVKRNLIEIPTDYEGPDLGEIARATGLSENEVVTIHSTPTYRVRFMGFMPGFPYLDGLDPRLQLPRRASPRPRVEGGAVAIAHRYAAIYPSASPGGWHWLGNTNFQLISSELDQPSFALAVGDLVRFIPN